VIYASLSATDFGRQGQEEEESIISCDVGFSGRVDTVSVTAMRRWFFVARDR